MFGVQIEFSLCGKLEVTGLRRIGMSELRKHQLEILDFVVEFCEENDIHYWLDSGTLLGAVRHKGYIPWDDDIDIGMLREDFDRFTQRFRDKCIKTAYVFRCPELDKNWHLPFGKVMDMTTLLIQDGHNLGINIDIFPFDDAPENTKIVSKMYSQRDWLKNIDAVQRNLNPPSGNIIRKMGVYGIRCLLHLFPESFFIHLLAKKARRYNGKGLKKIGNFTGEARMIPCERESVLETIDAVFENKVYKIPKGYDLYLQAFYGVNYMQLPPVEKRKHHSFEAYVCDEEGNVNV